MPTAPVVRSVTLQRARDAGLDRHVLGYLPATLIEQPPPAYHTPELGTPLPSPPSLSSNMSVPFVARPSSSLLYRSITPKSLYRPSTIAISASAISHHLPVVQTRRSSIMTDSTPKQRAFGMFICGSCSKRSTMPSHSSLVQKLY